MVLLVLVLAAVVVVVDQASKVWAETALDDGHTIELIGELLRLRLTYNPGAAFSIGSDYTWVFTVVTAVVIVVIGWLLRRVGTRWWAFALGLILGGATTHLLDRLLRDPSFGQGHVVDFIDYGGLFVGNIADIALVTGVGLAILLQLRGVPLRGGADGAAEA